MFKVNILVSADIDGKSHHIPFEWEQHLKEEGREDEQVKPVEKEFLLTHHYQSDFSHVHTRWLFDFTLVGASVWSLHIGDRDGSIAQLRVSYKFDPIGEVLVVHVRLASCIR